MPKLVVTILGARPQFIKAKMVSRAIAQHDGLHEKIIHTGQHYDANMSDVFFKELDLPLPYRSLNSGGKTHVKMVANIMSALEEILAEERPEMVIVYGDTNSTLAATLAASILNIPIAHIEAGLRSFNKAMPEEKNRIVADHLSDLLFCPTKDSIANLQREGITENVFHVGDVMFDLHKHNQEESASNSDIINSLALNEKPYAVCTLHRAENTTDAKRLSKLISFIEKQATRQSIILPLHPRTRDAIKNQKMNVSNVKIIDPLGYKDMQELLKNAQLVITDSGGLQKEAFFHKTPCIILREETEWNELVRAGWNRLWTETKWSRDRIDVDEFGQGDASQKIVAIIGDYLANNEKPG